MAMLVITRWYMFSLQLLEIVEPDFQANLRKGAQAALFLGTSHVFLEADVVTSHAGWKISWSIWGVVRVRKQPPGKASLIT